MVKAALEPLYEMLDLDSETERLGALKTLGVICRPESIPFLMARLGDSNSKVHWAAVGALINIFDTHEDPLYLAPFLEKKQ